MKERHCSHCFQCLFSRPCAGFFFPLSIRAAGALAFLACPGHILMYAPVACCVAAFLQHEWRRGKCVWAKTRKYISWRKPDYLADESFGFYSTKVHPGVAGKKTESVKRHGWRDPSGQGCVSVFPFYRLFPRPRCENYAP